MGINSYKFPQLFQWLQFICTKQVHEFIFYSYFFSAISKFLIEKMSLKINSKTSFQNQKPDFENRISGFRLTSLICLHAWCTQLAAPPAADHIPYWYHGLEVYPGSCSLRPTFEIFAVPPRSPEVAVHSTHRNRGYSLLLLLVPPQLRLMNSLCGMGFLCRNDCSPGFFLTHSTLASKLFCLAVQGSGVLLSSNLEGALYKSP